jgi:hypothetical protein
MWHIGGEGRSAYRVFFGNSDGKRPFGRVMHRWNDALRNVVYKLFPKHSLVSA